MTAPASGGTSKLETLLSRLSINPTPKKKSGPKPKEPAKEMPIKMQEHPRPPLPSVLPLPPPSTATSLEGYGFKQSKALGDLRLRKGTIGSIKSGMWLYSDEFVLKVEKILCGNSEYRKKHSLYDLIAYDVDIDLAEDNSKLTENRIRIYLGENLSGLITQDKKTIRKGELIVIQEYAITRVNPSTVVLFVYKIKGKN